MDSFFDWSVLGTFAGASAAVALITQAVKGALAKVPTQLVSYAVAVVVLVGATAAAGATTGWEDWALVPLNAVVVSLAANGGFDAVKRAAGGKSQAQK